jgi:hypothetical protein
MAMAERLETGSKLRAGALFIGVFILIVVVFQAGLLGAANWPNVNLAFQVIGVLGYLLVWCFLALYTSDALAFVYGIPRPWLDLHAKGLRIKLGKSMLKSWGGALLSSTISFLFSLYGFAMAYLAISAIDADQFNVKLDPVTTVYFTVVTAATVGFGDIYPKGHFARVAVTLQILFCFAYAILLLSVVASKASRTEAKSK